MEATEERGSWEEEGTGHVTQAIFLDFFKSVAVEIEVFFIRLLAKTKKQA